MILVVCCIAVVVMAFVVIHILITLTDETVAKDFNNPEKPDTPQVVMPPVKE